MSTHAFEEAVAAKLSGDDTTAEQTDAPATETTPAAGGESTTPVEEQTTATETDTEKLLAGKYESPEALERAYQELQSKFNERDGEIGEVRRLREELDSLRGRVDAPQHDYDALISANPAAAAQLAYEAGDAYHLNGALEAWKDEDPFAAAVWYSNTRNEARMAQLAQSYEERLSVHDQGAARADLSSAMSEFAKVNPDLEAIAPTMVEIAEASPNVLALMQSDDLATKLEVFDFLAVKARARLGVAATPVAPADEENTKAKQDAALLSGTSSATHTAPETPASDEAREIKGAFREHFGLPPL